VFMVVDQATPIAGMLVGSLGTKAGDAVVLFRAGATARLAEADTSHTRGTLPATA